VLALIIAALICHRMTVLTPTPRPGKSIPDAPEVRDVYASFEARDARLEQQSGVERESREAAERAEESRTFICRSCGEQNSPDAERCWNCDAEIPPTR
jgi:ribosomal protein L40E